MDRVWTRARFLPGKGMVKEEVRWAFCLGWGSTPWS